MKNHYETLQISTNASLQEIKLAYKKLAWKYHPDQNLHNPQEAEEIFKKINEAYHVLSNPERKQWYDLQIGLRTEVSPLYHYQRYQREQESIKETKKAFFQEFIKRYTAEKQAQKAEVQETVKKAHLWIGSFFAVFVIFVVIINFLDLHERNTLYKTALLYYKSKDLKKSDSIANILMTRKPKNENYYLLHIQILIEQGNYEVAHKKLRYSKHLSEKNYRFWFLVCQYKTKGISPLQMLEELQKLEQNGFREASFYLWRALVKFEVLADRQTICQDLRKAIWLGEIKAEQFLYVCL
jgi:hypothetical protein